MPVPTLDPVAQIGTEIDLLQQIAICLRRLEAIELANAVDQSCRRLEGSVELLRRGRGRPVMMDKLQAMYAASEG
jgi:hypothetical protein